MHFARTLITVFISLVCYTSPLHADEFAADKKEATQEEKKSLVDRATTHIYSTLEDAMALVGIRYRRGGQSPETGFDCSGFVGHVFRESMGLVLPRSAKEISKTGTNVAKNELKPGDLVFFNTMRKTFSHVGIYLGGNMFVHSPRSGASVRVEDMSDKYWVSRYNGARRVAPEDATPSLIQPGHLITPERKELHT